MRRLIDHVRRNAVAYVALFIALGGTSYAAIKLPANSVGTKQLRKNAITSSKVKNGSLLLRDFKSSQLPAGRVGPQGPPGEKGATGPAGTVPAPEAWHEVGSSVEPPFVGGWGNSGGGFDTVAFYKDPGGVAHLKGDATGPGGTVFKLPAGYRPTDSKEFDFAVQCNCTVTDSNADSVSVPTGRLQIFGTNSGAPALSGAVVVAGTTSAVALDGVTFRAGS